jgi:O-antigen/teichoic acid export membrane protein
VASVAFFSRANGLREIFNRTVLRAVLPICLPYFALAARSGERTLQGYLKATTLITGVGWPFSLVIGALSFSTIRLLYGPQWEAATHLAQILCVVAALELPYWLAKEVTIAEGRIDKANRLQFDMQALRLISLALVIPFGLLGACWGLVAATAAGGWVAQRSLHRSIGLTIVDLARACMPSAIIAFITSAPVIAATLWVQQNEGNYLRFLVLGALTSPLLWLASLRLMRHPLWAEVSGAAGAVRRRWSLFRSSRA